MKKHIIIILLVVCLSLASIPHAVFAAESTGEVIEIITMEDGSYITVTIQTYDTRATQSKSGSKTYTYRGTDGNIEWQILLIGTFTYTGTTSACTASSVDVSINKDNWYVASQSASRSYNAAFCNVTMGRKIFGITVESQDYSLTLNCDKDGNLS